MVSVIVCTFNRVKYLPICLEKLANQTVSSSEYEIIIIDNNSTDESGLACELFIDIAQNDQCALLSGIKARAYVFKK